MASKRWKYPRLNTLTSEQMKAVRYDLQATSDNAVFGGYLRAPITAHKKSNGDYSISGKCSLRNLDHCTYNVSPGADQHVCVGCVVYKQEFWNGEGIL